MSPMSETRVVSESGGHERSQLEDVWTSVEVFQTATALFGKAPSRHIDGKREPLGVGAAALALAWHHQTEALRRAARDAH